MIHRRWIGWLLSGLFLFNYFGYVVAVFIMEHQLKNNAVERLTASLPKSALTLVKIPLSSSNTMEQAKEGELNINGRLFDIVSIEKVNGALFCYCLNDASEETLLKDIDNHIDTQYSIPGRDNNHSSNTIKQTIKDYFFHSGSSFCLEQVVPFKYQAHLYSHPMSAIKQVLGPPPKVA